MARRLDLPSYSDGEHHDAPQLLLPQQHRQQLQHQQQLPGNQQLQYQQLLHSDTPGCYDGFANSFDAALAGVELQLEEGPEDLIDVDAIMAEAYPLQHQYQLQQAQQLEQQQQQQHGGVTFDHYGHNREEGVTVKAEMGLGYGDVALRRQAAARVQDSDAGLEHRSSNDLMGMGQQSPSLLPSRIDAHRENFMPMTRGGLERQQRPLSLPVELEMAAGRRACLARALEDVAGSSPVQDLQHLMWQQHTGLFPATTTDVDAASPCPSPSSSTAGSPFSPGLSHSFPRMQRLHDVAAEILLHGPGPSAIDRGFDSAASSPSPGPSPVPSDGYPSPGPSSPSMTAVGGHGSHRCDHCLDVFANKWTLARHRRNIHGGKRYKCRFCEERFNASHTRNRHETNIHQDDLKVTCKDNWCRCKKKFQNETQLRNHLFQKRKARDAAKGAGMSEEQRKSATF